MIPKYFINQTTVHFPVDQTDICTNLRLKDEVGNCPPDQLHSLPIDIRPLIRSITTAAKADSYHHIASKKPSPKYDPRIPTRTIHIDGFGVIKLHVVKNPGQGWTVHTIAFNPGALYNGHNGHILTEEQFLYALSILIEVVKPLLYDPDDWIHIVPGLHDKSRAWWRSVEIPFHVTDYDGEILSAYSHAKHKDINLTPFNARHGQSVTFANSDDDLMVRIYRKDLQLVEKYRRKVIDPQPVLRIEVRLKKNKLEQYLKAGVWKLIDGTLRLISFRPAALQQTYMDVISKFDGCYTRVPAVRGKKAKARLGRMMGWVATQTDLSIDDQMNYINKRFLGGNTARSVSNAKSTLRKAARDEQSLLSPVKLEELFSESAWHSQPCVQVTELEAMTQARHLGIGIHPLVAAAYGSNQLSI